MMIHANEEATQSRVITLYAAYISLISVYFLVAALLIYITRTEIDAPFLYKWAAGFIVVVVLSLIAKSMFNSKISDSNRNYPKWENIYAAINVLFASVFSVGYCYTALLNNTQLTLAVALILTMQLSCLVITNLNSRKTMIGVVLPTVLPFCGVIIYFSVPFGIELAIGITLFTSIFLILTFTLNGVYNSAVASTRMLNIEIQKNKQKLIKLESNSFIDLSNNIYNRRFFDLMIDEKIRRAKRVGNNLSLAIIEVDFFDEYRAHYGQEKTLKCMQRIAKILSNATHRGGEYMTCFDNKKFGLIAPNVPTKEAIAFTSKMAQLINDANIKHVSTGVEELEKITISVGIAEFKPDNIIDVDEIISQALFALETAHTLGHNTIQVYDYKNIKNDNSAETTFDNSSKPYLVSENPRSAL
ncbi:MAG: GGDEF domain-containing protein [Paraglaciecola sp.]|uniref:GGDEF domain-containing protein n=1 Tax=Paraglaciecola sp. TaxID=1920173 RepID=UPI003297F7B6